MESDQRFYWRRAAEEYYAAERAVTPAARSRRHQLAEQYVRRLRESGITFELATAATPGLTPDADRSRRVETSCEWPLPEPAA